MATKKAAQTIKADTPATDTPDAAINHAMKVLVKLKADHAKKKQASAKAEALMKEGEEAVIVALKAAKLDSSRAHGFNGTIVKSEVWNAADWALIDAWAIKNKAMDIYQRRLTQSAVDDRAMNGVKIPGTAKFPVEKLSWTKAK